MQAWAAKDSTKSVPEIYNECQNEAADEFPCASKEAFLQSFPSYQSCQSTLFKERRTKVPANPNEPSAIDIESDRFTYFTCTGGWREESIIKGNTMMKDGSRILVLSTNQHLEFLARRIP